MRVLFLFQTFSFERSTIYLDLIEEMRDRGHAVTVIAGTTDRELPDGLHKEDGVDVVYLKLADQFGAGKIKKGLIQLYMAPLMIALIRKYLWKKKFDVIAYPTPPVTLAPVVKKCREHFNCITYLMLKDIFPQNAVDIGLMSKDGLAYKYFKKLERVLYENSKKIGCMSEGNIAYLKEHEPWIPDGVIEYFPNTVKVKEDRGDRGTVLLSPSGQNRSDVSDDQKETKGPSPCLPCLRFMFGGNMGKPQGIGFLLEGIKKAADVPELKDICFDFIGDGTESRKIEEFIEKNGLKNLTYRRGVDRDTYEEILKGSDIGIISLSEEFTIPNYPSRILSYMQLAKPVLAITDRVTDMKDLILEKASCGWWTPSGDAESFIETLKAILNEKASLQQKGLNGRKYLEENFNVKLSANILEKSYWG
ncbi:MAG: glycosyltransferase family 4 protein [Lachnospiraceae bacterium]|nr:glycosyltransferase family 4 protein [Lachnospiraceae bacterium]